MPARDRYHDQVKNAFSRSRSASCSWKSRRIRLIVLDPHSETIRLWIPQNPIAG
jgi:hypothetical protein